MKFWLISNTALIGSALFSLRHRDVSENTPPPSSHEHISAFKKGTVGDDMLSGRVRNLAKLILAYSWDVKV